MDQDTIADIIHDLCGLLKKAEGSPPRNMRSRKRLGSLSSSQPLSTSNDEGQGLIYRLHSGPDEEAASPTRKSVKLPDLFKRPNELNPKTRVNLGLMLAWGVLQISSTSWLSGGWSKDNILLVEDTSSERRPYVSHRFPPTHRRDSRVSMSSRRDSHSTLDPPEPPYQMGDWARDASLFALAVFLLEMCYGQSIEDMAIESERDATGKPYPHAPFLTACRTAKGVISIMGSGYAQAVNACLSLPDVEMNDDGKPKDSLQLSKSIYVNIIRPLKASAEHFGAPVNGSDDT